MESIVLKPENEVVTNEDGATSGSESERAWEERRVFLRSSLAALGGISLTACGGGGGDGGGCSFG